MTTKTELLEALDSAEQQIGRIIAMAAPDARDTGTEPIAIQQARIRYGEGGLWLRHHIESTMK